MDETHVGSPRVELRTGLLLAGLRRRYTLSHDLATVMLAVARQWQHFHARKAELGHAPHGDFYGVCLKVIDGDSGFDYFCGEAMEQRVPDGFSMLEIPSLRYAVFKHAGPASALPATYLAIFGRLLPDAGLQPAESSSGAPEFVERFDEGYDLVTKTGGPEILVPLKD